MNVTASDTVLITGGGPVGLGGVVNAKYRGARTILVERIPYRQQKAKELGADLVLDPDDPEYPSENHAIHRFDRCGCMP